jgi:hypothetical protein
MSVKLGEERSLMSIIAGRERQQAVETAIISLS